MEIKWAGRVAPGLIRRLYASDAKGIEDIQLADEVGYGLYARADSLIKVNRAHMEHIVDCPSCGCEVAGLMGVEGRVYRCDCGFTMSQADYHATYKRKQLVAITIVPFAEKFMGEWEAARDSYTDKMRAIDFLIHCFHYELDDQRMTARPAAVNFIDCSMIEAIKLILELAYGDGSQPYNEQMERWLANAKESHLRDEIIAMERGMRGGVDSLAHNS